jgi:hypothetical protein
VAAIQRNLGKRTDNSVAALQLQDYSKETADAIAPLEALGKGIHNYYIGY